MQPNAQMPWQDDAAYSPRPAPHFGATGETLEVVHTGLKIFPQAHRSLPRREPPVTADQPLPSY